MTTLNPLPVISGTFRNSMKALAAGALALCLFAAANVRAATYSFTNTTGSTYDDPNAYSPTGGPGGAADTANFGSLTGTINVSLTNNFTEQGSLLFGANTAGATATYNLNFGTNTFVAFNDNSSSGSAFVFGQAGTTIVYIAVGKMYNTNSAAISGGLGNARMTIGRNSGAPGSVFFTNGVFIGGVTVIANNAGATPSQLVVSGSGSSWSNSAAMSIGNVASANNCSLAISNSASMTVMSTFELGFQAPSSFNSVIVDTSGSLFTRNQTALIGSGAGSSNNTVTVRGGGLWDNGGRIIQIGNTSGSNNSLIVGNNGVVSNVSAVTIATGNSLTMAGGLLSVSVGVTNSAGAITGSGTIAGNTVFTTGTGVLSPGAGTSVGTLTFTNNLTLVSGTTTIIKLDKGQTGSNDLVNIVGTMAQAGTLTVNNVGSALAGGDTFQVFSVGTHSGNFAVTNLPPLTGSLVWNTTLLGSQGIISVVLPPTITGPGDQAVLTNSTVIISTTVTGVPVPGLQWLLNGASLMDGPTTNGGSSISGSTTSALTINNAQVGDSGSYCLVATNFGGAVTNCMTLTVAVSDAAPTITGPTDQNVIQGNTGTFSASVAGIPIPTQKWQVNGVDIPGATGLSVGVPNVQFSQDGSVYSIIASNSVGSLTNSAVLHVVVPPAIATQPQSLTVTNTQSASFTVVYTNAVPPPTYQWFFGASQIGGATNATYTIPSASPASAGQYHVVLSNVAGSITSSNATLTVDSVMTAATTPANGATAVCYDTPLYLSFSQTPVTTGTGKINIYDSTNSATPVDTIDTSTGNLQSRTIGTEVFNTFPVIITGNQVAIYPHLDILTSNQTYFVTVDPGTFADTTGALFVGVQGSNSWSFTTKPTVRRIPTML